MSHPLFTADWWTHHRERQQQCWRHDNLAEVLTDLAEIEQQVQELLAAQQARITTVTVTATQGDIVSKNLGDTITFTAASTDAAGNPVTDTYEWTTTAGTIAPGPDSTTITISDAPVGDVTATATDPSGVSGSATETVTDAVATVTVTAS